MKFKIERTSYWEKENPIDDERLFKEIYNKVEIRTLSSFEAFDKMFGEREGTWLSKGFNHKINEQGYIQREILNGSSGWFIEINTLEELMGLKNKIGNDLIICDDYENPEVVVLEFYDENK